MIRTATTVLAALALSTAGCGKSAPPEPAPVAAADVAASHAAAPEANIIRPVTMAPPMERVVGHPTPKDRVAHGGGDAPAAAPDDHAAAPDDHAGHGHDPDHPPIDCPLAAAGVDAHHHKPFADTEKYIAHLERADRAVWQKPDEVVTALKLTGSEKVYDIGAGSGYFSFRFAAALPSGSVVAADTEPEMVRHVHHKAMTEGIGNVTAKVIATDDPGVSDDVDLVFICDVLHHVEDRPAWMAKLASEMKPGARLAVIEFKMGELPVGPPEAMRMTRAATVKVAEDAGLTLVSEETELLPYQVLYVFRKG
ncbi:MAG: hypothetical protein CVU56_26935 [Deltaproteobacteria bacterium HGW-Deltaproteobacteria-14]|jgi:SAM-dependent methyltransferase|nr:MAG: hypothetical protein CVU56_26935 [Deltaproteobacteria bacterium HGW-Deltaproteobacteria-14]